MKLENFVYLMYASNTCYTSVVDQKPDGLEIDLQKDVWTFCGRAYKIGSSRTCETGCRGGVIGVYDRTNLDHLSSMTNDAKEATTEERWVNS